MANEFDPYREALVVENVTIWPEEYDHWESSVRAVYESRLHAAPQDAADLQYIRVHTGFRRQITVTDEDIDRISA